MDIRLLGRSFLLWGALMAFALLGVASAEKLVINCATGGSVNTAIKEAQPGDVIEVSGNCKETVLVPAEKANITLDGLGKATLSAAQDTAFTVTVLGRNITVKGFTITGGRIGIAVGRGAFVIIDSNKIGNTNPQGTPGFGIGVSVNQTSSVALVNNTIENNPLVGILIHERSSARIGFVEAVAAAQLAPNTIQNNAQGIIISRGGQARVVGGSISKNKGDGVRVERGGHLEIAASTINANGGNGISVTSGSGLELVIGPGTITDPNKTEAGQENAGLGLLVSLNSYATGRLGSLNGLKGSKQFDASSSDGLQP